LVKFYFPRGILIAAIGIILVVVGASLFDNSYDSVESMMKIKHNLIEDQTILRNQSINSTIQTNALVDHNVVIVHVSPSSDSVKLISVDPNGDTFEKESKNGFVYHIIEKNTQVDGNYSIVIYNLNDEPITVNAVLGEDPFLSGKCDSSHGVGCYIIPIAIGFVIVGIVAFIIGALLAITDFRKQRKRRSM
jgi:hypothetical protein